VAPYTFLNERFSDLDILFNTINKPFTVGIFQKLLTAVAMATMTSQHGGIFFV
jgi:hypothetical protein